MTDLDRGRDACRRVFERPSPEVTVAAVEDALAASRAVSLAGRCAVGAGADPPGGSEEGEHRRRHVLVKPDGAVVVHGASGTAPVGRLGPGGDVSVHETGGRLRIETGAGDARGHVEFERVDLLASFPLEDRAGDGFGGEGGHDDVSGREGDHATLRDRLLDDPELVEPGFEPRSTERETPAGPVDLFGRDAAGRAVAVEVKAHRAGPAAVGQLDRYVSALRRDLHADAEVRGVLVAPSATERARRLLADRGFDLRELPVDGGDASGGSGPPPPGEDDAGSAGRG